MSKMSIDMPSLEEAKKLVPPKKYFMLMKQLVLTSIYLNNVKVKLSSQDLTPGGTFDFKESSSVIELDESHVLIEVAYKLGAKNKLRKNLLSLTANYRVLFNTKQDIPVEFFTIYKEDSLPLQTFPYFRELTNSLFSRCGLPPLILPLRKYLVSGR